MSLTTFFVSWMDSLTISLTIRVNSLKYNLYILSIISLLSKKRKKKWRNIGRKKKNNKKFQQSLSCAKTNKMCKSHKTI